MSEIIRQKNWTADELTKAGFRYFPRKKHLVMARYLPEAEAPMTITFDYEAVTVEAGYVIVYDPGTEVQKSLNDYDHWPCRPDIFFSNYKPWDEPDWRPTPAQRDVMRYKCKPCYKYRGVWAKKLSTPIYVQTVESTQPTLIPAGAWLGIGDSGDPYSMTDEIIKARYILPERAL